MTIRSNFFFCALLFLLGANSTKAQSNDTTTIFSENYEKEGQNAHISPQSTWVRSNQKYNVYRGERSLYINFKDGYKGQFYERSVDCKKGDQFVYSLHIANVFGPVLGDITIQLENETGEILDQVRTGKMSTVWKPYRLKAKTTGSKLLIKMFTHQAGSPAGNDIAIDDAKLIRIRPEKIQQVSADLLPFDKEIDPEKLAIGQIYILKELRFEADSFKIEQVGAAVLDEVVAFLENHEYIKIEIRGHTNGLPAFDYCDRLSKNRARAVSAYLVTQGIDPGRVEYKGYGKRIPIATNSTKAGRQKNQRVELRIVSLEKVY